MRGLATLLAVLLLLAPLAASSDGDGSSSSSSSSGPSGDSNSTSNSTSDSSSPSPSPSPSPHPVRGDGCPMPGRPPANDSEQQACLERYCRQNPGDERCQDQGALPRAPRGWDRWCRDEARDDAQRQRCRQAIEGFRAGGQDHWVTFKVDAPNATLLGYTVAGTIVFDSIHLETGSDNLTVEHTGDSLVLGDVDTQLVLHDDPTGLVRFKGDDGSVTLRLPAGAVARRAEDDSVAAITFAGGRVGYLRADNATWLDGRTILLSGFFAFLIPPPDQAAHDAQTQAEVKQAIEDRKVGAEITVGSAAPGTAGNGSVKVLAYDDVNVQVRLPAHAATPDAPIRVELSADLSQGRTIVLNLNRSVLQSGDPASLVLRYYDLHAQGDGSTVESEVPFHQASSLQDVLDPTDDQGQPEYWVVQDANGLQVLASVPHWSAHAITVASVAQALEQPNVLYGIVAGSVGTMLAAVAMLWPRRRDDL